jgi:hypothetical protein
MAAVRPLKRQTNRAHVAEVSDSDDAIIASIVNESGGNVTGNLYGAADSTTTTVNLGTGAGVTAVTIGVSGTETTIAGNLIVSGTTTTIDTANLTIEDKLVHINNNAGTEPSDSMGISMERGSTGEDAVFVYSTNSVDRFEFGFFETSSGTVAPSTGLTVFADAKLNNLLLAGTNITSDGALTIATATGALTLADANTGAINIGTDMTARTTTIGNATGASTVDIDSGTGGTSITATGSGGIDIDAGGTGTADFDGQTVNLGGTNATGVQVGNATTTLDLDSGTGGTRIDSTGVVSIDAVGASNFTTASGDLTLSTTTSGDVDITSAGDVGITSTTEIDFVALGSNNISLNQSSDINFRSEVTNTGINSIIGAINGIIDGTIVGPGTDVSLQEAYVFGNTIETTSAEGSFTVSGTETVLLNAGSSTGAITLGNASAGAVTVDSGAGISLDGAGTSNFSTSAGDLDLSAFANLDLDGATVDIDSAGALSLDGAGTSNFSTSSGDLDLSAAGELDLDGATVALDSAGILSIDAAGTSNLSTSTGTLTIEATGSATGDNLILSAGAIGDITFAALGSGTETYNQSGDLELNSVFTAGSITSLIGALNAIQDGRVALSASVSSANDLKNTYTVASGETLELGDAVYISGTDEVSLCDANAAATSDCVGFAETAASAGDTVSIITDGIQNVELVVGLTVGAADTEVHAGAVVFLSGTAGKLTTDDSAFIAGDTVHAVGFIKDIISYDGATGNELVEVQIRFGEKTTLA